MILSILYIILALLGIGFLIFIHELGHYFMARKVGITVEVFAIGLGKSIYEWERKGVKWKIGCLPFGGYVKMAGMEKVGGVEPSQIEGGFLGSKPWSRIKVAAMGPIVNIVFAFLAFSFLWVVGGRDKPFAEFTHIIGWVQEESGPYEAGIRPGDAVTKLNDRPFKGFQDFLYGAALDNRALTVSGEEINYETGEKIPFTYTFSHERPTDGMQRASLFANTLNPASYLIYETPKGSPYKLLPGAPMAGSGISHGDRILWVDGVTIFSMKQLVEVLNAPKVLLTIERDGKILQTRIPHIKVQELQLGSSEKEELDDWSFEANLKQKIEDLYFIPYNINADGVVEEPLSYIDEESESKTLFESEERIPSEIPLLPGDRILAVQGEKISTPYEFLEKLQTKKALIIVKKAELKKPIRWTEADTVFIKAFDFASLKKITDSIGTDQEQTEVGTLTLLMPVTPMTITDIPQTEEQQTAHEERVEKYKKSIEEIPDQEKRKKAMKKLEGYENRLMLGLPLQDKMVAYNPQPFALFGDVFKETYRTLYALVTGYLSPKYVSGPIGIVQVIHHGWTLGVKEALFWLGMISLNLGLLNLLPVPVLDGGYIIFAIWESITKKPLKAKTMERLIIPFVILLIAFFVYLTYNDIVRIISQFFS